MDKDKEYASDMIVAGNFKSPRIPEDVNKHCITTMRWTTERFHFAIKMNVLGKYDRIELVEGHLWCQLDMSPKACSVERRLDRYFRDRFSWDDYHMDGIRQLVLPPCTSASPDFKVHNRHHKYDWPTASDTHLVVEVMEENSVHRDHIKKRVYALGGIKEYWIADIVKNTLQIYTKPDIDTGTYLESEEYDITDIAVSNFAGKVIVNDILPSPD